MKKVRVPAKVVSFFKSVDLDLSFKRDENDQIIGMEINYNGSKQCLQKLLQLVVILQCILNLNIYKNNYCINKINLRLNFKDKSQLYHQNHLLTLLAHQVIFFFLLID